MNDACRPVAAAVLLALASAAGAQSSCSSDGQAPPSGVLERFVNADCEGCWTALDTPEPAPGALALDWIVPGSRGEDAPLSPAARDDALARLAALGRPVPPHAADRQQRRRGRAVALRVAHGPPFNGYIGASIELTEPARGAWRAWLLLVESIPAGGERSPVARNVVRNALQLSWRARRGERPAESRSMNIPEGAQPDRLRVIGLLEDARGRLRGIARSRCALPGRPG